MYRVTIVHIQLCSEILQLVTDFICNDHLEIKRSQFYNFYLPLTYNQKSTQLLIIWLDAVHPILPCFIKEKQINYYDNYLRAKEINLEMDRHFVFMISYGRLCYIYLCLILIPVLALTP